MRGFPDHPFFIPIPNLSARPPPTPSLPAWLRLFFVPKGASFPILSRTEKEAPLCPLQEQACPCLPTSCQHLAPSSQELRSARRGFLLCFSLALSQLSRGLRGAERGSHPPTQNVSIFPLLVFLTAGLRWSELQIGWNKSLLLGGLQL